MIKKYKIEDEYKKNNNETTMRKENKKEKRVKNLMPKITPKSSEIKIKYSVKERNKNVYKSNQEDDDNPIYKLQNIQKYIKGILK